MAFVRHGTLVADTVTTVTLDSKNYGSVEVTNRSGDSEIYFIALSAADANDNPSVEGDDCEVLPAAVGALVVNAPNPAPVTIKLISDGTPAYSIRAE